MIGRRDPASASYPDVDLSSQGESSTSVSRRHAQIIRQKEEVFVEDLKSSNGTILNGKNLEPGRRYPLKNGDELRFGLVMLIFLTQ